MPGHRLPSRTGAPYQLTAEAGLPGPVDAALAAAAATAATGTAGTATAAATGTAAVAAATGIDAAPASE